MARPQRRVVTDILRLRPGDIYGLGGNDTNSDGGDHELRGNNGQDRLDSHDGVWGNDVLQDGEGRRPCQADRVDYKKDC